MILLAGHAGKIQVHSTEFPVRARYHLRSRWQGGVSIYVVGSIQDDQGIDAHVDKTSRIIFCIEATPVCRAPVMIACPSASPCVTVTSISEKGSASRSCTMSDSCRSTRVARWITAIRWLFHHLREETRARNPHPNGRHRPQSMTSGTTLANRIQLSGRSCFGCT